MPYNTLEKRKAYLEKNKDKSRKYQKEYYQKNKEKLTKRYAEWCKVNREKIKAFRDSHYYDRYYGLSFEEYQKILLKQDGKCAICNGINLSNRKLSVDHNHKSNKIRGLLCGKCNTAIGLFNESIELLEKAIDYLEKGILDMPIECFREILAQADSTELKEGKSWYPEARKKLEKISIDNQVPLETAVGICAVLSPQVEWSLNLKSAERFIRSKGRARGIPGYKRNRDKARAILSGDYSCIRGPKVEAFFKTILNPSHDSAVIDSQMIGAFYSGETDLKDIKTVSQSSKRLQGIREAVQALAEERGERVSTVQAQIWLTYKRLKGRYCDQLKLWK